jgi:hypothetical protein
MREAGIAENLAGLSVIVLMDQDSPRQDAKRSLDDAHILVKHQMVNIRTVKQRANRRNQHDVVGSNQFPHLAFSLYSRRSNDFVVASCLAAKAGTFYGYIRRYGRLGKSGRYRRAFAIRTFEPKPHWINKFPVSFRFRSS